MRLTTREVDNHITHTLQLWKRKSVHPCQKSPSNHSRLPTPENAVCLFDGAKKLLFFEIFFAIPLAKWLKNGITEKGRKLF